MKEINNSGLGQEAGYIVRKKPPAVAGSFYVVCPCSSVFMLQFHGEVVVRPTRTSCLYRSA